MNTVHCGAGPRPALFKILGQVGNLPHLVLCMLFLAGMAAHAQVTATITGQVRDATSAVVADASVTVKSLESGATRVSSTDTEGRFRFLSLPLGPQEVKVEK